ncbi:MAG: molybdopterin-dependent oxidoreductase [Treponema sp.]|jgi:anaerobic dimethyl sulfoxide reductase subunit A|nr:molybdopterin-dependent oxidoreductase [Treponema sp.]
MKTKLLCNWYDCHDLCLFFDDFPKWLDMQSEADSKSDRESLILEYDALFKGVDAEMYVPLWASVCKAEGVLLDMHTLEVVKQYHSWGYAPEPMDGNPPDFIGQQYRFLCYLYASGLYTVERGAEPRQYIQGAEGFIADYLKDTAAAAAQGIRRYGKSPVFFKIADRLVAFTAAPQKPPTVPLPDWYGYAAYCSGPGPAIQDRPEQFINTAGRNNCGGKCAIQVREQEGCILGIRGDRGLVGSTNMRACIRGLSYRETYLDPRRLRYPMQRIGRRGEGRFRRISWEDAADITAEAWTRIRDAYGPASRYVNYSTGVSAVLRPDGLIKRLLSFDGGYLGYYNSYSSACSRFITPFIYGDVFSGNSPEDILNTRLLILWGHNPKETIFGSDRNYYIAKVREKGIPIIVIDPRQSDTVRSLKGEWIPIRPSTDAALADAMAYVIWSEGLQDQGFMDAFCLGFDEAHIPQDIPQNQSYQAYLFGWQDGIPKTPVWAEGITGVSAGVIADIARRYATAKPACLLPGLGPQRTGSGEQTVRTLAMLTCLTGNVGIPGGGAAGIGSVPGPAFQGYPIPINPYPGKIPSFLWTRAVEHAREMTPEADGLQGVPRLEENIKMICNLAGNTLVNQHSDINKTIRLLKDTSKCEFILCSDVFMTSSAQFGDILLPASSFFEDENIAPPWDFGNYLLFNNRVIDPVFGSRFEYAFIEALARRLGLWELWSSGYTEYPQWLESIYAGCGHAEPELPDYETFKRAGGYHFKPRKPYIAYEDQIRNFEGHPFPTPSGKIEIFSQQLYTAGRPDEVPPIPGYRPCPEGPEDPLSATYPLQLIGWHTKRRTHSIHDKNPKLAKIDPQRLWIHPEDAKHRGLQDGDLAEVWNNRGKIRIPVHITPRIISGTAALAQGAWYSPDDSGIDTAGSLNVLTSQVPTPFARGNPQHTNLVEVKKMEITN